MGRDRAGGVHAAGWLGLQRCLQLGCAEEVRGKVGATSVPV